MPIDKQRRAEIARQNGSKSNGPNTAEGRLRCAQAARDNQRRRALPLSFDCTLLPTESRELYDSISAQEFAYWQPTTPTECQLVLELIDANWKIKRIRFAQTNETISHMEAQRQRLAAPELSTALLANAEVEGAAPGGPLRNMDHRAAGLSAVRSRIIRDLERLSKRFPNRTGSQPVLQTNHLPAEFSWRVPAAAPQCPDGDQDAGPETGPENSPENGNGPVPAPANPPEPAPEPELEPEPAPAPAPDANPASDADPGPAAAQSFIYEVDPDAYIVPQLDDAPDSAPNRPTSDILAWAAAELDFHADSHQSALMTTDAKNVLMLGGRQTGKSTAAAIRAIFEAIQHGDATILLAGPTGRQSGQIMAKSRQIARKLGIPLAAPPPGCDGFRLPNGSYVISLPDSEQTIRGFSAPRLIIVDEAAFASNELFAALKPMLSVSNGAMLLLSTPNGQSGYFYERWHEPGATWFKILCRASECARISPQALDSMRRTMSDLEFRQEFNCEFTASSAQSVPRELFRRSLRTDIKPLFEEENNYDS